MVAVSQVYIPMNYDSDQNISILLKPPFSPNFGCDCRSRDLNDAPKRRNKVVLTQKTSCFYI